MSDAQQRPAAELFNNSTFSDMKLKQVSSDGKVREYYVHKAILSGDSRYFYKAFTGNFREATEAEMTIHDDDPDHFEFFLKFIYTHNYDKSKIDQLANGDPLQRVKIPCEILILCDKYDMPLLNGLIANDIEKLLTEEIHKTLDLLKALIPVYYKGVQRVGGPLSNVFVTGVRAHFRSFFLSEGYVSLVKTYPVFGADMALLEDRKTLYTFFCGYCGKIRSVDASAMNSTRVCCWKCTRSHKVVPGNDSD